MILLVVDTQKGCFDERLYAFETVRNNIKQLITIARENNVEVVYVQHDDGPGTELDKTADNYEIYEEFAPREDEKRFEKGFNMLVPSYANSTYDNPYFDKETAYKYYNEFMWGRRYAKIITVEQAIQLLQGDVDV
ncbi:MAG: isochorismatase family protein [Butyrivibrio hungatei]|nr:isochorismatase family protein [Butyrivibrio hungatei]